MRLLTAALLVLFSISGLSAQTSPADKAQVAEIRQMYAAARERIRYYEDCVKDGLPANDLVVRASYMAAGAGPCEETRRYHYEMKWSEVENSNVFYPYFISCKTLVKDTYSRNVEVLFNERGELVFYYERYEQFGDEVNETRYYWGKDRLVHQDVKGTLTCDDVFAHRMAMDYKAAFNMMMNIGY